MNDVILNALRQRGAQGLTAAEAWHEYGVQSVAVCIHRLRKMGYGIKTTLVRVKTRYGTTATIARYTLD